MCDAGVFFTTKADGTLDIWDYYSKQNDPIFSTKVSSADEHALCTIKVQSSGRAIALGATDGSVTVVQISRGLSEPQNQEKAMVLAVCGILFVLFVCLCFVVFFCLLFFFCYFLFGAVK